MYNIFGDYIHRKRINKGLSLRKFADLCGISHTHIDSIEKGIDFRNNKIVRPSNDTVQKIATALKINKELLFTLSLEQTADKFEFFFDHEEREEILRTNSDIPPNETLHLFQRLKAAENIFKAYFSQSIEYCKFNSEHINYTTYVSLLLSDKKFWKDKLSSTVYDNLVSDYGITNGELQNNFIYNINKTISNVHPNIIEDYTTFPVIGDIAAGYDKIADENWEGESIDIPNSYLKGRAKSDFFVLKVSGDSMYPLYIDGDYVLILKQTTLNHSGEVGAVLYEDTSATLKKVEYVQGEDWMKLIPINPNYPPKLIEGESLEHCRILGIPKLLVREIGK